MEDITICLTLNKHFLTYFQGFTRLDHRKKKRRKRKKKKSNVKSKVPPRDTSIVEVRKRAGTD